MKRTLAEHLVLDHEVEAAQVLAQDWRVRLAKHQELHPQEADDDHAARRHVHLTGQYERDCFVCSGRRYGEEVKIP